MSTDHDDATGTTRLSVNLAPDTAAALREEMDHDNISATEAVRRAIALLKFYRDETAAGNRVAVVEHRRWWQRLTVREVIINSEDRSDEAAKAAVIYLLDYAHKYASRIRGRGGDKG